MASRRTIQGTSIAERCAVRRSPLKTTTALLGAGALLLGVSACGDEGSSTTTSGIETSPLMDAILLGGPPYAEFETNQLAGYHTELQTCLVAAGFEYTIPPAYQVNQQVDQAALLETVSAEGYGIATETDGISFAEDDSTLRLFIYPVTQAESDKREQEFQAAEAKNEEYVNSLDEDRAAQYEQVRNGELSEESFEVDENGELLQSEAGSDAIDESCEAQASTWLADPGADLIESEEFAGTYDKIMGFYDTVDSDESITKIYQEWSQCVAQATQETFALPEDITNSLTTELEAAYGELDVLDTDEESVDLGELLDDGTESLDEDLALEDEGFTLEDEDLMFEDDESVSEDDMLLEDETYEDYEVDEAALAALTEREIKLATADVNCRFEINFFERIQNAQIELEKKFVSENKDELGILAQAISEARESVVQP